jgi:predicted acylesterase/phospholipase RssA
MACVPEITGICRAGKGVLSRVTHVIGASGGALVASVLARAPHRIDEAIEGALECRNHTAVTRILESRSAGTVISPLARGARLVVSTADAEAPGQVEHRFEFPALDHESKPSDDAADLPECLRATCTVPIGLHPLDLLLPQFAFGRSTLGRGHEFRGRELVDGGLFSFVPLVSPSKVGPSVEENICVIPFEVATKRNLPGTQITLISPRPSGEKGSFDFLRPWMNIRGTRLRATMANAQLASVALSGASVSDMRSIVDRGHEDCAEFLRRTGQED